MNKKSKKTLKDAFNIPEPNRKEQFFNSLEIRQPKKLPAHIPMYVSAVAAAVLVIGVWGGVKNLPYFNPPEITDTPVYSRKTSATDVFTENSDIQTTAVSVTGKNTDSTSVTGTATENITGNSETVTTITETEDNISPESTEGLRTTDGLSGSTAENRHINSEKTTTAQTTCRTATKTNTTTTRTVTTVTRQSQYVTTKSTAAQTHTTVSQTTTDDTVNVIDTVPQTTATTYDYGFDPPPCTEPPTPSVDAPHDYTVKPPVRYYPDDNAIDINDLTSNDATAPSHPSTGGQTCVDDVSWKDLAENSDLIVIATVEEIIYTGIDGRPYTQEDIEISEVIKGDIPEKSRISVYGRGGYIPAVDYKEIQIEFITENNYTLFDNAGNRTNTENGDTYLYFIKKSNSPFPDGSYILTGLNNISKFSYTDGCYENLNNSQLSLTLNALYSYLN